MFEITDTVDDGFTGGGGGGGNPGVDNSKNGGPLINPGPGVEAPTVGGIDPATIQPIVGTSSFAGGIGGAGFSIPKFVFSGGSDGGMNPIGIVIVLALLGGVGYFLYKRYKK